MGKRLLEDANRQLYTASTRDYLTGLFNRRHLESIAVGLAAGTVVSNELRVTNEGVLFLIDIDHFKQINDTYGHATGDHVLQRMAERLTAVFGDDGLVARWGGEEFLAIVPAEDGRDTARIASSLLHAVSAIPVVADNVAIGVTVSAGICRVKLALVDRPATWEEVLHLADESLYLAKQQGRNRAYIITDVHGATAAEISRGLHINRDERKVAVLEVSNDRDYA